MTSLVNSHMFRFYKTCFASFNIARYPFTFGGNFLESGFFSLAMSFPHMHLCFFFRSKSLAAIWMTAAIYGSRSFFFNVMFKAMLIENFFVGGRITAGFTPVSRYCFNEFIEQLVINIYAYCFFFHFYKICVKCHFIFLKKLLYLGSSITFDSHHMTHSLL